MPIGNDEGFQGVSGDGLDTEIADNMLWFSAEACNVSNLGFDPFEKTQTRGRLAIGEDNCELFAVSSTVATTSPALAWEGDEQGVWVDHGSWQSATSACPVIADASAVDMSAAADVTSDTAVFRPATLNQGVTYSDQNFDFACQSYFAAQACGVSNAVTEQAIHDCETGINGKGQHLASWLSMNPRAREFLPSGVLREALDEGKHDRLELPSKEKAAATQELGLSLLRLRRLETDAVTRLQRAWRAARAKAHTPQKAATEGNEQGDSGLDPAWADWNPLGAELEADFAGRGAWCWDDWSRSGHAVDAAAAWERWQGLDWDWPSRTNTGSRGAGLRDKEQTAWTWRSRADWPRAHSRGGGGLDDSWPRSRASWADQAVSGGASRRSRSAWDQRSQPRWRPKEQEPPSAAVRDDGASVDTADAVGRADPGATASSLNEGSDAAAEPRREAPMQVGGSDATQDAVDAVNARGSSRQRRRFPYSSHMDAAWGSKPAQQRSPSWIPKRTLASSGSEAPERRAPSGSSRGPTKRGSGYTSSSSRLAPTPSSSDAALAGQECAVSRRAPSPTALETAAVAEASPPAPPPPAVTAPLEGFHSSTAPPSRRWGCSQASQGVSYYPKAGGATCGAGANSAAGLIHSVSALDGANVNETKADTSYRDTSRERRAAEWARRGWQ
eukprot:TRINITY_DN46623_c0_g1_i1.p1 TRINITY_DN46623_c0_g1~~TRINITY_DN46623_c0_g1_i1.p1  ORF type:complete len:672 (-),score=98.29 TRINITY_DN46623_c0_g1_i1:13-2028(-)